MTIEHKSVITDGAIHGSSQHAHERGSVQIRFMEKLRESAKSATDTIGRSNQPKAGLMSSNSEKNTAVQDILSGFTLKDFDKQNV